MESSNVYRSPSSHRILLERLPGSLLALLLALLSSFSATQLAAQTTEPPPAAKPEGSAAAKGLDKGSPRHDGQEQRPASEAALFRAFAAIEGLSADYTEEKFLSLLAVPLKSKGKLHFTKPGYLARIVMEPEKSHLTITDAELRMADKDGEQVIDLRQSDRVRLFVTSLVQVLQGNDKALKQHYQIRYTQEADDALAWQLELQPLKEPLTKIIKRLVLLGRGKAVNRIELHEPNGDRTITKIVALDQKRVFSKQEHSDIFGVAPSIDGKHDGKHDGKQHDKQDAKHAATDDKQPANQAASKQPDKQK